MTLKAKLVMCISMLSVGVVTFVGQTKLAAPKVSGTPPKMVAAGEFAGEIRAFGGQACPANWLVADGTELPEAGHASLSVGGRGQNERMRPRFSNGKEPGAWFDLKYAVLYARPIAASR